MLTGKQKYRDNTVDKHWVGGCLKICSEHPDNVPVVVLSLHVGDDVVGAAGGLHDAELDDVGPRLEQVDGHLGAVHHGDQPVAHLGRDRQYRQ